MANIYIAICLKAGIYESKVEEVTLTIRPNNILGKFMLPTHVSFDLMVSKSALVELRAIPYRI